MSDIYTTPIRTEAAAEGFFFQLYQLGRLFHPEDNQRIVAIWQRIY